jgi:ABC-type transport system involved in multi-copper enzyme maturation permease subunit
MEVDKKYIIAGASLFLVILLILAAFSGLFFLLPRQISVILLGIFPLIILTLLVIALIALMTGRSESTPGKIISSTAIIGLLVIIAGIFVPIIIFETFFHNQGPVYESPEIPDYQNANYSRDDTTFIDISHKDGIGTVLDLEDTDYTAIHAECLEQIRCINTRGKPGFSRAELIAMKQNYSYVSIRFPAPVTFNTSYMADGTPGTITIDEAIFFLDSKYDDMIITPTRDGTDVWETSGDRGKLRELADPVLQMLSGEIQNSEVLNYQM